MIVLESIADSMDEETYTPTEKKKNRVSIKKKIILYTLF